MLAHGVSKKFPNTDRGLDVNMAPQSRPPMKPVVAPLKFVHENAERVHCVGVVSRKVSLVDPK